MTATEIETAIKTANESESQSPLASLFSSEKIAKFFPLFPASELVVEAFHTIYHATPRLTDWCKPIMVRVGGGYQRTAFWWNWSKDRLIDTNEFQELKQLENDFWEFVFPDLEKGFFPEQWKSAEQFETRLNELCVAYKIIPVSTGTYHYGASIPIMRDVFFVSEDEMRNYV